MKFNTMRRGLLFVCLLSCYTCFEFNLLDDVGNLVETVVKPVATIGKGLANTVEDVAKTTTNTLTETGSDIVKAGGALTSTVEDVAKTTTNTLTETGSDIVKAGGALTSTVEDVAKTTANTVTKTGSGIVQAGGEISDDVKEAYTKVVLNKINNIRYTLYTRAINSTPVNITQDNWPTTKQYTIPNKEFKFITHGWLSSGDTDTLQDIKDAYLEDRDINVVIVDWSGVADNLLYPIPAILTKHIGGVYGKLLNYLVQNGVQLKLLHLAGHSLGAHVSAFAARSLKSGKANRLTGLDPAMPGFSDFYGLKKTDANFVDIIHSCAGVLGVFESIGHVDFWPNGGTPPQPGCNALKTAMITCSHGRSHEYFAASISPANNFVSHNCHSWLKYKSDECKDGNMALMGDRVSFSASGNYYLRTNSDYPYAQG